MINIIICDDCAKTREIISNIVKRTYDEIKFNDFNIQIFNNSEDVITYTKNNYTKRNIYILDIDLNEERNGLNLGREIRKIDKYSSQMIFVTNHSQMVLKIFEFKLSVIDFIDKNNNLNNRLRENILIATNALCSNKEEVNEKTLQVKCGTQIINVAIKDIICFETIKDSKKVILHKVDGRIQFYSTLKDIKESLDNRFIQVHKSAIVNKNHIKSINKEPDNTYIELNNDIQCLLSRSGLKEVNKHWTY